MVFVCLSHFAAAYFTPLGASREAAWLTAIAMVASPTFVMISGVLLGWRHRVAPARFDLFRDHLLDRALFLLTAGHVAIGLSQIHRLSQGNGQPIYVAITDVIAIACIVGPALVTRFGIRARLLLSTLLYAASWSLVLLWSPDAELARGLKATLVGLRDSESGIGGYAVPLLPWLAVYLAASCLGHALAGRRGEHSLLDAPLLWRAGLACVGGAVVLRLGILVATQRQGGEIVTMLTATWQKVPPGPFYLLLNGGAGLFMLGVLARLRHAAGGVGLTRWLETVGRNSAIVFIAQFYVYSLVLPLLHPSVGVAWPLLFATTVASLVAFARFWERRGLNRLLTVKPLFRWLPSRPLRAAAAMGAVLLLLFLSAHMDLLARPLPRPLQAHTAAEAGASAPSSALGS